MKDCYGKDPNRGYAIRLSYDSSLKVAASASADTSTSSWKGVKGCVPGWPCWNGDAPAPVPPPSAQIPTDNHETGEYVIDPMGVAAMILYAFGFLLVLVVIERRKIMTINPLPVPL